MKSNLRIRVIWLFGIIAVVILLCCIFLFYSLFLFKSIRNQETRENLNNAVTIQDALNDTWDSMLAHALPLANSAVSKRLETTHADFQSQDAQALFVDMRNAIVYDNTMKDIALYYPKSDYIVGSLGIKSSRAYWALTYGADHNLSYDQWTTTLYCHGNSGFFVVDGANEAELYYRFSFEDDTSRVLVIRINREAIAQRLQWLHNNDPDSFAAVLLDGNIIYTSWGNANSVISSENEVIPKNSSFFSTKLPASVEGMEYLSLAKKTSVFRLSSSSLMIAVVLLILSILMCIVLIRWIIRQHIRPLEKMASRVVRGNAHKNEIQIIDAAFEALLVEQHSLEALYDQQQAIIAKTFMDELLRTDLAEQKNLEDVAASFGYSMENAYYCMIARTASSTDTEEATAAFVKAQNDLSDGSTLVWWTRKQGVDFFLVNYDDCSGAIPEMLHTRLTGISGADAVIVHSQAADTLRSVKELYQQCCESLGCSHLFVSSSEEQIPTATDDTNPILEQFQQLLVCGNIPDAQKLTHELFVQYVADEDPLRFNTKNYLIIHFLLSYTPAEAHRLLAQLPQAADSNQWEALMSSILDSCAFLQDSQSQMSENDIATRIRKLIDRQYTNPLLDLHMLASQVNLSQSYISRLFKLKYNISVAQYINSVRIKKAKELILLGNDSIKAISIKVGFSGDSQFIRAYKRIEGVTPGNFRSANSMAQSSGGNE